MNRSSVSVVGIFDDLTEGDPEPVQIPDDELPHSVERVVWALDDLDAVPSGVHGRNRRRRL
jgi:hypothetical protein